MAGLLHLLKKKELLKKREQAVLDLTWLISCLSLIDMRAFHENRDCI